MLGDYVKTTWVSGGAPGLSAPRLNNIEGKVEEIDIDYAEHTADSNYQVAGGTATAITVTTMPLVDGYTKTFIASATNASTAKTINGKPFYKPGTTLSPALVINKAYTVWYNLAGDCFFIKASAEGDTLVEHVLAGKIFSNDDDTGIIGTMPNKDYLWNIPIFTAAREGGVYIVPPNGWYAGSMEWQAHGGIDLADPDYVVSNIRAGASIFGMVGIFASPHSSQVYTIPGTYSFTVPANVNQVTAIITGGGGGGSAGSSVTGYGGGAGGDGGSYIISLAVTPGAVISVIVGVGGAYAAVGYSGAGSSVTGYVAAGGAAGGVGSAYGAGGVGGAGGGYGDVGRNGNDGKGAGDGGSGGEAGVGGTGKGGKGGGTSGTVGTAGTNGRVVILW